MGRHWRLYWGYRRYSWAHSIGLGVVRLMWNREGISAQRRNGLLWAPWFYLGVKTIIAEVLVAAVLVLVLLGLMYWGIACCGI